MPERYIKLIQENPLDGKIKKIFFMFFVMPNNIKKLFKNKSFDKESIFENYFGKTWKKDLMLDEYLKVEGGDDAFDFGEEVEEVIEEQEIKTGYINYIYDPGLLILDSIDDLRNKLFIGSGIPLYRQHIFKKEQSGSHITLYEIKNEQTDIVYKITPDDDTEEIANVNIDSKFYLNRDDLLVKCQEMLIGIGSIKFILYLWDIEDHLVNLDRDRFNRTDDFLEDNVYYGLIKKYYPIFDKSMFLLYLSNEKELQRKYKLIYSPIESLYEKYNSQIIFLNKLSGFDVSKYDTNVILNKVVFCTPTAVLFYNKYQSRIALTSNLNVRNIVDLFTTDKLIPMISAVIINNDKIIKVIKTYKFDEIITDDIKYNEEHNKTEHILFVFNVEGFPNIEFRLFKNGEYYIYYRKIRDSMTRKELFQIFSKIIDPVIEKINNNEKLTINKMVINKVIFDKVNLTTKGLISTEIDYMLKWNEGITKDHFSKYERIVNEFEKAGLVSIRDNLYQKTDSIHLLKYVKGIFPILPQKKVDFILKKNKILSDYYKIYRDYSIRKIWDSRFVGGIMNIENLSTGIRFTVEDVHENSLIPSQKIVAMFINEFSGIPAPEKVKIVKNIKKKMEELDPDLYKVPLIDGKKYARVCQKKFRPIGIYTEDEYQNPAIKQKSLHKFINYTTKENIYYECPKKMDNLGFIVGKHPKGFCIPKCKEIETEGEKVKLVKSLCHEKHIVNEEDLNLFDPNNIVKFGRTLKLDRFSYIHDYFYEILKIKNQDDYLLVNANDYKNVPLTLLDIYAKRNNLDLDFLISDIISKLDEKKALQIYTESNLELDDMKYILNNLRDNLTITVDWLNFIQNVIYNIYEDIILYFDTRILDKTKEILTPDVADFEILLNKFINMTSINENLIIIVMVKDDLYPITYQKDITKKYEPEIINRLVKLIKKLNRLNIQDFNTFELLSENEKIKITERYIIGNTVFCVIAMYKGKQICIGTSPTSVFDSEVKDNYNLFKRKNYKLDGPALIEFISDYVSLDEITFLCNNKKLNEITTKKHLPKCTFIGLHINNVYSWFDNMSYEEVIKITKFKYINIEFVNYDIDMVNKMIKNNEQPNMKLYKNISDIEYEYYIHFIFENEFLSAILSYNDTKIRSDIKKIILEKIPDADKMQRLISDTGMSETLIYDLLKGRRKLEDLEVLNVEIIKCIEILHNDLDKFKSFLKSLVDQRCVITNSIPDIEAENIIFMNTEVKFKINKAVDGMTVVAEKDKSTIKGSKLFYKDKKVIIHKKMENKLINYIMNKYTKYNYLDLILRAINNKRNYIIKSIFEFNLTETEDIEVLEI